jgi:hypothetical protein
MKYETDTDAEMFDLFSAEGECEGGRTTENVLQQGTQTTRAHQM